MKVRSAVVMAVAAVSVVSCSSDATSASPTPAPVSSSSTESSVVAPPSSAAPADACAAFLAPLSLRQKLAQLLTVGVTGTEDAENVVQTEQVGGVFVGSWTDESMLTGGGIEQVKAASPLPLLVTIDEEGGRVSRVEDLLGPDPSARDTVATKSVDETYQMALERGRQLKDLGITVNFAPVVDVSDQPDDSVIGDRSYSDDPAVVTEYAGAYARGMRDAGVLPVIKHFPGHGSGSGDSHTGAVTTPSLDELQTKDLVPYRTLVTTGAGVMVGHLDVPGLTTPGVPASISPEVMALLREGIGYGAPAFDGPIFTDDLSGMAAITSRLGIAQAVSSALEAGADVALWLTTDQVPEVLDHLEQEVASGALPESKVDAAVVTVGRWKGATTC